MIAPALYTQIISDSGVSGLIGDRLYPSWSKSADQLYPLGVYKIESETQLLTAQGPNGMTTCNLVVAAIAETYAEADAVAEALLTALNGSKGTWSGVTVQGVFVAPDGLRDDVVTDSTSEAILLYIRELTFEVIFVR